MKIEVLRTDFTSESTIGRLSIDGAFQCYTLEDAVRADGVKIYGETAIPTGLYDVVLTRSPRFKRVLPLLLDVKNFVGVRIHPGNSARDTEGCILVGEAKAKDWISKSRPAFNALFAKMKQAQARGEKITLELK